jgi:hypothetical protein
MNEGQVKSFERLGRIQKELSDGWIDYWSKYSNIDTWQFWVNLLLFILPLIILFFTIDRKRAFHIGFFGYSVHMMAGYIDGFATRHGLWEYPFKIIPFLPISITLDTSLIPVVYMLLYQWTLNRKKNYYIYAFVVGALFSLVIKPILANLHLFQLENGSNYFYLFLFYLFGSFAAKWITNVFVFFERNS